MRHNLQPGFFYGRTLKKRCLPDLSLADVEYRPHSRLPSHSHDRPYFCLIRRGTYTEKYSRRVRFCEPKMMVFHPAGERHCEVFGDRPVLSFNVELGAEWLGKLRDWGATLDQPTEFRASEVVGLGARLFHEFTNAEPDSELQIKSIIAEILAVYAKARPVPTNPKPDWLLRACEELDSSLQGSPSLEELAKNVGIHPVHFAATFRRFNGCSVGEYVRRQRIVLARQMLTKRTIPLAEIALLAGFADQSHLTRVYKRFTGRTPSEDRTFLTFKTESALRR